MGSKARKTWTLGRKDRDRISLVPGTDHAVPSERTEKSFSRSVRPRRYAAAPGYEPKVSTGWWEGQGQRPGIPVQDFSPLLIPGMEAIQRLESFLLLKV